MTGMDVDIADPAHKADPYPFYARPRAESPVHRMTLPDGQVAWLVARYDDVVAAQKGRRLVQDKANALPPSQAAGQPWVPPFFRPLTRNMLDLYEGATVTPYGRPSRSLTSEAPLLRGPHWPSGME